MLARTRVPWRQVFNPDRDFEARRPLRVSGVEVPTGAPFPKTLVSVRTLRQLFEMRKIHYVGEAPGQAIIAPGPPPVANDTPRAIAIPADWPSLSWPQRRALATRLGAKAANGAQAAAAIEAELERRARAA